ncbi:hypothetical protein KAU55_00450 [Candidatus Bathyarchaeota archaeon]|nr:hypothetical protein [Candidatus Bathyarchaeota archaeon]
MTQHRISEIEAEKRIREVVDVYLEAIRKIGFPVEEKSRDEEDAAERITKIARRTIQKTYNIIGLRNTEKVLIVFDSSKLKLSREETHSLIYLLDREKNMSFPGYRYVPYRGPYSELLQNDVNLLTSIGNLEMLHSHIYYTISKQGSEVLGEKREEGSVFAAAYDEINIATQELLKDFGRSGLIKQAYYILSREMARRMRAR